MSKILESEFRKELYKSLTEAGYEKKEAQAIVGKKYYETLKVKLKEDLSNALDKVDREIYDWSIAELNIDETLSELAKMKEFAK
jgi:uncharacterized protein YpiB (UPF0302 family)